MFSLNESNNYQVYSMGVDMRKGVESLCCIVRSQSLTPTDGRVYVFMNRTRCRMKLLHWERGGYVIYYKRMEQGRLSRKMFLEEEKAGFHPMRWDELVLHMEGVYPSASRRKRYNLQ